MSHFDVIVVGGGHAGIEAASACERRGLRTLMVTSNVSRIGFMSCNPAIGGLAKGHIVREIDALGGEMGRAADETCIQFKRLNSKKGPAVRGSRAQCDKDLYSEYMQGVLSKKPNLKIIEGEVKKLLISSSKCEGVVLEDGSEIRSSCVVITTGTFMNGVMHVGLNSSSGGRVGDRATSGLSQQLGAMGFKVHRLKTGTPPRLIASSIAWSKTVPQFGDERFYPFGFLSDSKLKLPQVQCFLTYTTEKTHQIIKKNLHLSPMYCGIIEGVGPRYCPSIEDKVVRFVEKERHQTFLEPEGLNTDLIYLQGISTSLPESVQQEFLQTIIGLENVKMARPGYAIEYDFFEPTQMKYSLETKVIENLFCAGQINGTSGYEEAAAQGLVAGINAVQKIKGEEPFVLRRDQAYIGVLVDDLVTKGTLEPYRMFTSRAEHRLVLREDNTLDRLLDVAKQFGLVSHDYLSKYDAKNTERSKLRKSLVDTKIYPNAETNRVLVDMGTAEIINPVTLENLLRRPEISIQDLAGFGIEVDSDPDIYEPVEVDVKYSGYVGRQLEMIEQAKRLDSLNIPKDLDFSIIHGLSREEVEKLNSFKPFNVGQASRISGVNPSAIHALLIHLKGKNKLRNVNDGKVH